MYARIALRATERPLSPLTRRQAIRLIQTSVPHPTHTPLSSVFGQFDPLFFPLSPFTEITEPLYNVGPSSPRRGARPPPRRNAQTAKLCSFSRILFNIRDVVHRWCALVGRISSERLRVARYRDSYRGYTWFLSKWTNQKRKKKRRFVLLLSVFSTSTWFNVDFLIFVSVAKKINERAFRNK